MRLCRLCGSSFLDIFVSAEIELDSFEFRGGYNNVSANQMAITGAGDQVYKDESKIYQ